MGVGGEADPQPVRGGQPQVRARVAARVHHQARSVSYLHQVRTVAQALVGHRPHLRHRTRLPSDHYSKERLNVRMPGMAHERKTALLAQFARVAKALASPVRLELVDLLAQAERSVEDLASAAGLPVGNTSAQLRELHAAGLVASRREGIRVFYRLAGDDVAAIYRTLRQVDGRDVIAGQAVEQI